MWLARKRRCLWRRGRLLVMKQHQQSNACDYPHSHFRRNMFEYRPVFFLDTMIPTQRYINPVYGKSRLHSMPYSRNSVLLSGPTSHGLDGANPITLLNTWMYPLFFFTPLHVLIRSCPVTYDLHDLSVRYIGREVGRRLSSSNLSTV